VNKLARKYLLACVLSPARPLEPRFRSPTLGNIAVSIPGFVLGFFFSRFLAPGLAWLSGADFFTGFFSF
jgi:hypothetical protein